MKEVKNALIVGPSGSGKTALAAYFAERNRFNIINLGEILKYIALTLVMIYMLMSGGIWKMGYLLMKG